MRSRLSPVMALPPKHPAYFIIGRKGAGKSALAERMAEIYWWLDYVILDLNSAFDLESLHWCIKGDKWHDRKGKWHEGFAYPILLITPSNMAVTTDGRKIEMPDTKELVPAVKTVADTEPLERIIMTAYNERRVVVFSIYLYAEPSRGQHVLARMVKALPVVMRDKVPDRVNCAMLLRELADIASNRMKSHSGYGERETKRGLSWFFRQARHARTTCICDMQNSEDVYGAIEAQEDFVLIKRLSLMHVPKKLSWLVDQIKAKRQWAASHYILNRFPLVSLDHLSNNAYYCVYPSGHYQMHWNSEPRFRHHRVNDNALQLAGITIKPISTSVGAQTEDAQIAELQAKKQAKESYVAMLNRAVDLYIVKKKENPGWTWQETAADNAVNFKGKGGQPAGDTLIKQVHRYSRKKLIARYAELLKVMGRQTAGSPSSQQ